MQSSARIAATLVGVTPPPSLQPCRTYSSPYSSTRSSYHQVPYDNRIFPTQTPGRSNSSLAPLPQLAPVQLEPTHVAQELSEVTFVIEEDDGSLFGDGDMEELSNSIESTDGGVYPAKSAILPCVEANTPVKETQPRRISKLHFPTLPSSTDDPTSTASSTDPSTVPSTDTHTAPRYIQPRKISGRISRFPQSCSTTESMVSRTASTSQVPGLRLSPHEGNLSTIYPTPGPSPLDPDVLMMSVEKEYPPVYDDMLLLRNRIHKTCAIPRLTKKSRQEYAALHGLIGSTRTTMSPSPGSYYARSAASARPSSQQSFIDGSSPIMSATPSTLSTPLGISKKKNGRGSSSTPINLTSDPPAHFPPTQGYCDNRLLYQQISSLLYAKLAASCTKPHTVPQDLGNLFDSLEKKFNDDVNFRNSVLIWAICRMRTLHNETPLAKEQQEKGLKRANDKIQAMECEKEIMKTKMADMAKYIAYLEGVQRDLPPQC